MKREKNNLLYKQKKSKKLNKLIYNDNMNNKFSHHKINNYITKVSELITYLDTDLCKNKQNSVIRRQEIEKSRIYLKNSFKTLKRSFNNAMNSEENSNLYNHIKESKENISLNEYNKGLLTTKSKKVNTSKNKDLSKTNSYIKKNNLKKDKNVYNDKKNLMENLNSANKSRGVLKKMSNSNCKYLNEKRKINEKIKSFGLLPIENNKNSLVKMLNNNCSKKNNYIPNYYSQKNSSNFIHKTNSISISSRNMTEWNEDDIFFTIDEKQVELTKEEKALYGDRIMKGYFKTKLLGKGGYGLVWLCHNNYSQKEYAIKQTSKKKTPDCPHNLSNLLPIARNEIAVLSLLNNKDIDINKEINKTSNDTDIDIVDNNCELIPKIYDAYEDNNDIWLSFEKGGNSLSNLCFKIKGEFEKGERIYLIQKGQFLVSLFSNISQFKYLFKELVKGINYINNKGIIHSDIKPENILIEYTKSLNSFYITSIKIIDYGSAFLFNEISSSTTSNTPEYLCPEITTGNKNFIKDLTNNNKYINAVDIWSLGITFLEMCLCCPIWMNFKSKIIINKKIVYSSGIFGCRMRDSNKIYHKQIEVYKNLNKILKNSLLYMFQKQDKDNFIDLLGKMLNIDYTKRINTEEILNHPFLKELN
jgi:serine/threonine protein kinase